MKMWGPDAGSRVVLVVQALMMCMDGPDSGNRGGGEGNMKVDGRQNSTANNSWLIYAAICKLLSHTQSNVYYT